MRSQSSSAVSVVLLSALVSACGPTSGGFRVTVAGEEAGTEGFSFPATGSEPGFEDGWEVKFDSYVVSLGQVTFSQGPETNMANPAQVGADVARLDGPWVVDLAKEGPLTALGGEGKAYELGVVADQNLAGNAGFDPTQRYAVGYRTVVPPTDVRNVNNVPAEVLTAMRTNNWTIWVKGTATFKGTACRPATGYDFGRFPRAVEFSFGYRAPTVYKNCRNGAAEGSEDTRPRGLQPQRTEATVAQLTFHPDHFFWDTLKEDAPLRFDIIAARGSVASGMGPASATATNATLQAAFDAPTDAQGGRFPRRFCGSMQAGEDTGNLAYDPDGKPLSPLGGAAGLKNLEEFNAYNVSTLGHLNGDGLCVVERQFPSPP